MNIFLLNYLKVLLAIFAISLSFRANAQSDAKTAQPVKPPSEFADLVIPPLGELVDAAWNFSPLLDEQTAMVHMRDWELQTARDEWGKYILFFTEVRYGSIDILVSNGGTITYGDKSNSTRYNVGARFQMSIFDALDLRQKVGAAAAQKKFEEAKQDELKRMIKDDVIRLWNKLVSYKEIVAINEDHVAVQSGNLFYAEQQFRAGDIPLLEYARIKEISIKADQEYQLAKKEFRETYLLLENIIGVKFSELKRAAK